MMATSDLASMMMVNPTMFDPTQLSNQFSNYNNQRMPYPPSYGGTPVNAATGQPIQSYQNWLQQNPGGMTLNATPAQPQQAASPDRMLTSGDFMKAYQQAQQQGGVNPVTGVATDPQARAQAVQYLQMAQQLRPQAIYSGGGRGQETTQVNLPGRAVWGSLGPTGGPAAAPQGAGQPNNWQAALSALANPGNPVTQGAIVPQMTGSQPAGGVNQAWLNQAGAGQGMNQNFLSALRAIQGR
jgi:hypothetical protein